MLRALALLSLLFLSSSAIAQSGTRVIDGDTIVRNGERIRLSGIDAPSIQKGGRSKYSCEAERVKGMEAKARVEQLLTSEYRVVFDRYRGLKRRDQYGRTLGKVRVGNVDVGQTLINEGLAKPWTGRGQHPGGWC